VSDLTQYPDVYVEDVKLNPGIIPRPLKITHGRSTAQVQPDAPTCEFEYLGPYPPCRIGQRVVVKQKIVTGTDSGDWLDSMVEWVDPLIDWYGNPLSESSRFVGKAATVVATEQDGQVVSWKVVCIGEQASLGRIYVDMDRPYETDFARVLAIAAKVGVVVNIAGTTTSDLGPDAIQRSALSAFQELCKSTGGLFWQDHSGNFWYGAPNHRAETTDWVLPAGAILDGVEWSSGVDDILNHLTITWPAPELPPAPITGPWAYSTSTDTGNDPGSGNFRTNNVDPNQITQFVVSQIDATGTDASLSLIRRGPGTRIFVQEKANASKWARWTLIDAAQDNGQWFTMSVDFNEDAEAGPPAKGVACIITFDSRTQFETEQETFSDDASIAMWGFYGVEMETLVASEQQASLLALTILSRRAQPYWLMPGVLVPYEELNVPNTVSMQFLDVSVGILAPVPDAPANTPAELQQWAVEGYVEEWREDGYWAQLSLSDWGRSSSSMVRTYGSVRDGLNYAQAAAKTYQKLLVEVV